MGVNDSMDDSDFLTEQLRSKIWRSVDQQIALGQTENGATAGPVVAGMVALANLTGAAESRDANAGAGSQQNHLTGDIGG